MPTKYEARRLSGVDIGKTIEVTERAKHGNDQQRTGQLVSVRHYIDRVDVLIDAGYRLGAEAIQIDPLHVVTITGKPS